MIPVSSEQSIPVVKTDVLVVGGGLAGCRAAIRAREICDSVTLVDKGYVSKSGSSSFTNMMLAPVEPGKGYVWRDELVDMGEYFADQDWVEILVEEHNTRVQELLDWGAPFVLDARGQPEVISGRGHKNTRAALFNGHGLMALMRKKALETGVNVMDRLFITDLLTSDGQLPTTGGVTGALGFDARSGQFAAFQAKAVVFAGGSLGQRIGRPFTNNLTGDSTAMAFRAGATLNNMEFCFSGGLMYFEHKYHSLGHSPFQGAGARFLNARGENFMWKYDPVLGDKSKLSYIAQASAKEILEGRGPLFWDMTGFRDEDVARIRKILPMAMAPFDKAGIDIRTRPLEYSPYMEMSSGSGQGGIVINTRCESTVPGLYGAGATCWNPIQGTYSVSGINMAFNNTGGFRAGDQAARHARKTAHQDPDREQVNLLMHMAQRPLNSKGARTPDDIVLAIRRTTIPAQFSLFKTMARIDQVLGRLTETRSELQDMSVNNIHDLVKSVEVRNIIDNAELIYRAAGVRRESRNWHYREEAPFRDNQSWLKRVLIKKKETGPDITVVPIPLEKWPLRPKGTERIPHPVQFNWH